MAQLAAEVAEIFSSSSLKFNWKIKNFSKFTTISFDTDVFSTGTFNWKARIYPKGRGKVYDHLSLFLVPIDLTKTANAEFRFAITIQRDLNNTVRKEGKYEFSEKDSGGRDFESFMPPNQLHDPNKGYIVDDTCIITVDVTCWMKEENLKDHGLQESESKRSKIKDERRA